MMPRDRTPASRRLIERFAASPYFDIAREETSPAALDDDLALGRVWLAIVIPAGLGAALEKPPTPETIRAATVQVLADGTDANSSGVALSYVQGVVAEFNAALAAERGDGAEGPAVGTVTRTAPQVAERREPAASTTQVVVRRATRDDIVQRLRQQQREQDAQRVAQLKIRERGLPMKLTKVEHNVAIDDKTFSK